jgi:hypothetical protein
VPSASPASASSMSSLLELAPMRLFPSWSKAASRTSYPPQQVPSGLPSQMALDSSANLLFALNQARNPLPSTLFRPTAQSAGPKLSQTRERTEIMKCVDLISCGWIVGNSEPDPLPKIAAFGGYGENFKTANIQYGTLCGRIAEQLGFTPIRAGRTAAGPYFRASRWSRLIHKAPCRLHSYRSASTGSMREAFSAGHIPAVTPTSARMTKAVSITLPEVLKMMSPSWFAVLYISE